LHALCLCVHYTGSTGGYRVVLSSDEGVTFYMYLF